MLRVALVACVAAAACKSDAPSPSPSPAADPAKRDAAPPVAPDASPVATAAVTPAAVKSYSAYLREGRAHSKAGRMKEAIAALEKAVAVAPRPRAYSELGYAAFKAKRYEASIAASRAALVDGDPRVEAASRYNLGLAYEATGKTREARHQFAASQALRPNAAALAAYKRVGGIDSLWPEVLLCDEHPMSESDLQACLGHGRTDDEPEDNPRSTSVDLAIQGGFAIIAERHQDALGDGEVAFTLAKREGEGWLVVSHVGKVAVNKDLRARARIDDVREKTIGDRAVTAVDVTLTTGHLDDEVGGLIREKRTRRLRHYCLSPGRKSPKCTKALPLGGTWHAALSLEATDPDHAEHFRAFYETDSPASWNYALNVSLDQRIVILKSDSGLRPFENRYELW